jgi:hypothetical protein
MKKNGGRKSRETVSLKHHLRTTTVLCYISHTGNNNEILTRYLSIF